MPKRVCNQKNNDLARLPDIEFKVVFQVAYQVF